MSALPKNEAVMDDVELPSIAGRVPSGIDIPVIVAREQCANPDPSTAGEYPFTRGIFPDGYNGRMWTIRQYSGFGTAEESNERYQFLLAQGQTGLSVALDLPTQCGFDPTHPMARSEIGKVGVSLSNLSEAEILFQRPRPREDLDVVHDQRHGGDHLCDVPRRRRQAGRAARQAHGDDPERHPEGVRRARHVDLPGQAVDAADRRLDPVSRTTLSPRFNPISIAGAHVRDAGCTAAEEMAYTLANGLAYVDELQAPRRRRREVRQAPVVLLLRPHGLLRRDRQVPRRPAAVGEAHEGALRRRRIRRRSTSASASCAAARRWSRRSPTTTWSASPSRRWRPSSAARSRSSRARSTRRSRSRPSPRRSSRCARSRSSPTKAGSRAQSIRWAAATSSSSTPIGWRRRSSRVMQEIDDYGGVGAGDRGRLAADAARRARALQRKRDIDSGDIRRSSGQNHFRARGPATGAAAKCSSSTRPSSARVLGEFQRRPRTRAYSAAVERTLARLEQAAAKDDENLMPYLVDCCHAYVTVGEMVQRLKTEWGEFKEPVRL